MARVTTLPAFLRPMMGKPSVRLPYCPVCGHTSPLEQHHPVRRGAGRMYDATGRELAKPTITLCGFGSNLRDADGRELCHGLAHHNRLHFRWADAAPVANAGHWEFILLPEPTDYLTALGMDGWQRLRTSWAGEEGPWR